MFTAKVRHKSKSTAFILLDDWVTMDTTFFSEMGQYYTLLLNISGLLFGAPKKNITTRNGLHSPGD